MSKCTIRDFMGDYALDIEPFNGHIITLYFNSLYNARIVKQIIEADDSVPNVATRADVVKVRCGLWIASDEIFAMCKCSVCHEFSMRRSRYCPNCGAKMERSNENAE